MIIAEGRIFLSIVVLPINMIAVSAKRAPRNRA